jgi:hypothetical protein
MCLKGLAFFSTPTNLEVSNSCMPYLMQAGEAFITRQHQFSNATAGIITLVPMAGGSWKTQ